MIDPEERVHEVASHARGVALLALFAFAPWWTDQLASGSGLQLLVAYARGILATLSVAFTQPGEWVVVNAFFVRRTSMAFLCVLGGALLLAFAPRRFARLPILAASLVCCGVASIYAHYAMVVVAFELAIRQTADARWFLAADAVASVPFALVVAATVLMLRWSEWAVWWVGPPALACLVAPLLGLSVFGWGLSATSVLAAITWWREARRWDELPRPEP